MNDLPEVTRRKIQALQPIEQLLDAVEWTAIPLEEQKAPEGSLYATHEGVLKIGDCSLRCFTLNDGQRVFDAEYVAKFFGVEETR